MDGGERVKGREVHPFFHSNNLAGLILRKSSTFILPSPITILLSFDLLNALSYFTQYIIGFYSMTFANINNLLFGALPLYILILCISQLPKPCNYLERVYKWVGG